MDEFVRARDYRALLRAQLGLITVEQARRFGLDEAALRRRVAMPAPVWQRVLPRVYATFLHGLTAEQKVRAAMLYAGDGAALSGGTAVRWQGVNYLPSEVKLLPAQILIPARRACLSQDFVAVHRTTRLPDTMNVAGIATVHPARAVADCALGITSYDTVLALVSAAMNSGRTNIDDLSRECAQGARRGSKLLRQVLLEAAHGTRSVYEAKLRQLVAMTDLPAPEINVPILVDGLWLIPDLRWGWFIVEINSRAHHLLMPGTWQNTIDRQITFRRAGYEVLPVSPTSIMDCPDLVVGAIVQGYQDSLVRAAARASA